MAMSYLDSNPSLRADLRDAGRLGYGRFDGPDSAFHEECGVRWDRHDSTVRGAKLPFGCLDETIVRWREGDR
jgi:hypothetical protein